MKRPMSPPSSPEEEATSSPEKQNYLSSRPMSPAVATRESLEFLIRKLMEVFCLACNSWKRHLDVVRHGIFFVDFPARQSAIASADIAGRPSAVAYIYFAAGTFEACDGFHLFTVTNIAVADSRLYLTDKQHIMTPD